MPPAPSSQPAAVWRLRPLSCGAESSARKSSRWLCASKPPSHRQDPGHTNEPLRIEGDGIDKLRVEFVSPETKAVDASMTEAETFEMPYPALPDKM
jgi:hypothetical protein